MKKLFTLAYFLLSFQISFSQWEECNNGLYGASVLCMAVNGNNIYAGTYNGGIFLSTDNGEIRSGKGIIISNVRRYAGGSVLPWESEDTLCAVPFENSWIILN